MPLNVGRTDVPAVPRTFADDLSDARKTTGQLDAASAQQLVTGWQARTLSPEDATALKTAVLNNAGAVTDPQARKTLQTFLDTLPSTDPRQDINLRLLGAPQLHTDDISALVQHWSNKTLTPSDAKAIDTAALEASPRMDADAKKAMQGFLLDRVPQQTSGEYVRDPRTTLLIAAFDDGHIDANDAQRLVQQWSGKPMTAVEGDALRRQVLGSQGFIDPGPARETIQRFLDSKLPTKLTGEHAHRDFDSELKIAALGDGKISTDEMKQLAKTWSKEHFTPDDATALKNAATANAAAIEKGPAQAVLQGFIDRNLPRLIVNSPNTTTPGTVRLTWTPPFTNVDGTPLTNLGGYVIKYGQNSAQLDKQMVVSDAAATSAEVNGLPSGTWYFEAFTTTTDGNQSGPSNMASKTLP
jgi:hypothetical protein